MVIALASYVEGRRVGPGPGAVGIASAIDGRTVATVAEICFAAQWVIVLHRLGTMTGADTTLNVASVRSTD